MQSRWRIRFMHTSPEIDGVSANTYALAEAVAIVNSWHPRIRAKVRLVPA